MSEPHDAPGSHSSAPSSPPHGAATPLFEGSDRRGHGGDPAAETTVMDPVEVAADPGDHATTQLPPAVDPDRGPGGGRPGWFRRTVKWWGGPVFLLLVAAGLLAWLFASRAGTALPGVTVEGIDVSGMTRGEITSELESVVAARQDAPVTITGLAEPTTFRLGPEGYVADVPGATAAALATGRDGALDSVVNHVAATFGRTWELALSGATVDRAVTEFVDQVAADVAVEPFPGEVTLDPDTGEVTATPPHDGARLDAGAALAALRGAVADNLASEDAEPATIDMDVEVLPAGGDPAAVEAAAAQLEQALSAPYVLTAMDRSIELAPEETARLLQVAGPDGDFVVSWDRDGLVARLGSELAQFTTAPVPASYEVRSGYQRFVEKGTVTWDPTPAVVEVRESTNGTAVRVGTVLAQLDALLADGGHEAALQVDVVEPELTTERAEQLRPDSLLGTFRTMHVCCQVRIINIHRLADLVDGTMLLPGESFSVNDTIGPRTIEKGFVPAGAIVGGELQDEVGGGISQFATTTYNAAFFAGIQIDDWRQHSFAIDRYPYGREATLNYGSIDLAFTNDTQGALIVKTDYTPTSITVSIFGVDDGRTVTAEMGEPTDITEWEIIEKDNPELPVGTVEHIQSGREGFTITYSRIITGGTTPGRSDHEWTYSPEDDITHIGTCEADCPPPEEFELPVPIPGTTEDDGDDGADG